MKNTKVTKENAYMLAIYARINELLEQCRAAQQGSAEQGSSAVLEFRSKAQRLEAVLRLFLAYDKACAQFKRANKAQQAAQRRAAQQGSSAENQSSSAEQLASILQAKRVIMARKNEFEALLFDAIYELSIDCSKTCVRTRRDFICKNAKKAAEDEQEKIAAAQQGSAEDEDEQGNIINLGESMRDNNIATFGDAPNGAATYNYLNNKDSLLNQYAHKYAKHGVFGALERDTDKHGAEDIISAAKTALLECIAEGTTVDDTVTRISIRVNATYSRIYSEVGKLSALAHTRTAERDNSCLSLEDIKDKYAAPSAEDEGDEQGSRNGIIALIAKACAYDLLKEEICTRVWIDGQSLAECAACVYEDLTPSAGKARVNRVIVSVREKMRTLLAEQGSAEQGSAEDEDEQQGSSAENQSSAEQSSADFFSAWLALKHA